MEAVGDFQTSNFMQDTDYHVLLFIIWLILVVVGNIIFMNFIIAVVSESYENCMNKMTSQQYRVKVDLIVEREAVMLPFEQRSTYFFPNFIIMRRPVGEDEAVDDNEWRGFVKEINKIF